MTFVILAEDSRGIQLFAPFVSSLIYVLWILDLLGPFSLVTLMNSSPDFLCLERIQQTHDVMLEVVRVLLKLPTPLVVSLHGVSAVKH